MARVTSEKTAPNRQPNPAVKNARGQSTELLSQSPRARNPLGEAKDDAPPFRPGRARANVRLCRSNKRSIIQNKKGGPKATHARF
jgi:hypothetical protein